VSQDRDVTGTGRIDRTQPPQRAAVGLAFGVAAFSFWGLVPVYFKAVGEAPPLEVLAHRVVWAMPILAGLVLIQRQGQALREALRNRRIIATLLVTTALIGWNWFVFIWAMANDLVLQASLGYFINPLVNVALGVVFLREHLSRAAMVAVMLASVGVGYLAVLGGEVPWVALMLAVTFGLYGLLRKTVAVGAVIGLAIETALLTPVAVAYLAWVQRGDQLRFGSGDLSLDVLLMLAGVVTTVPLLFFTQAARLLPLSTLGFLQYLAPTMHFALAVLAYGEPFHGHDLITFGCIWVALVIFTADRIRRTPRV
jgi:chloramphenicol-sensitive protein RarD